MDKKELNNGINEINNDLIQKKNGMILENNDSNEKEYNGKDFAKNKVMFNLYDMIK